MQKVDGFLPDFAFMDIRLPGENGLELTKKIKTTHPDITIFIDKTFFNQVRLEELVRSYYKI